MRSGKVKNLGVGPWKTEDGQPGVSRQRLIIGGEKGLRMASNIKSLRLKIGSVVVGVSRGTSENDNELCIVLVVNITIGEERGAGGGVDM